MNISTSELLSYTTILENMCNTNLELMGEINRMVQEGFCKKEEVEKTYAKSAKAYEEAKIRRTYDKPSSVDFQVECLKNAGFNYIGIPYKYYVFAVFWAKK